MESSKRRRLGQQAWGEVMKRFEGATMTVSDFCTREGLNTASFYRWRTRLASSGPMQTTAGAGKAQPRPGHVGGAGFIELGSLASAAHEASPSLQLRLELGGGLVLQITKR